MTRPAGTPPTWATGALRRIAPNGSEITSGFVEATRTPAKKANGILGPMADWVSYYGTVIDASDELTYPVAKTRGQRVNVLDAFPAVGTWSMVSVTAVPPTGPYWWQCTSINGTLVYRLNDYVRAGQIITAASVTVAPGVARAGANRMSAMLQSQNASASPPNTFATLAQTFDNGAAGSQIIALSPAATTVDKFTDYFLVVQSGNTANLDAVQAVTITLTDPGPRNV